MEVSQKKKVIEDITQTVLNDIPMLGKDLKKCLHIALEAAFTKMDLVTREEFDLQTQLLARTRERLEAIQQQLDAETASGSESNGRE